MSEFTKGPWTEGWSDGLTGPRCAFTVFIDHVDRDEKLKYSVIGNNKKELICIIPSGEHGTKSNDADARLISAAPDMYEALRELVNSECSFFNSAIESDHIFDFIEWRDRAILALRKATGESTDAPGA